MNPGTPTTTLLTTEDLLALPENGMDRELIRGELREKPMTRRNRWHSSVESNVVHQLSLWLKSRPDDGGRIASGEAGFRLRKNPDTTVGIDVVYVSAEVVKNTPESSPYFEGAPILAVEILSPSDTQEDIDEKIDISMEAGVKVIWIVNPRLRTVLVLRPGEEPVLFNQSQNLPGGPELPGFSVPVARIFE